MTSTVSKPLAPVGTGAPKPRTSKLANVVKGKLDRPVRALFYGLEGVGKSTLAAGAPSPLFLGADNGTEHLDVARLPEPKDWKDVMSTLEEIQREPHDYRSLVIDTINWLEPYAHHHLTQGKTTIGMVFGGYNKGFEAAAELFRGLQIQLERIWLRRGMHIVILAHAHAKMYKNPLGPDYDQYKLAMRDEAAGLFTRWCSHVGFLQQSTFVLEGEKGDRRKGSSATTRYLHMTPSAAYVAKFRGVAPQALEISPVPAKGWATFFDAVQGSEKRIAAMREELDGLLATLGDAGIEKQVRAYLETGSDETITADLSSAIEQVKEATKEIQDS